MQVKINGAIEEITKPDVSISTLLKIKDVESPEMVSVQLNGNIVEREAYDSTSVADKDEVDFLYFMGGGGA